MAILINYLTKYITLPPILHSQAVKYTSSAVIEDGGALWVLGGGHKDHHVQSSTQIVRPGRPTAWGPNMTEASFSHCSSTLEDYTVMVTGGRRMSDHTGGARTEVYSFTTQQWSRREDMNHRRMYHSCTTVWLKSSSHPKNGIIGRDAVNSSGSVLSLVVAGGEPL